MSLFKQYEDLVDWWSQWRAHSHGWSHQVKRTGKRIEVSPDTFTNAWNGLEATAANLYKCVIQILSRLCKIETRVSEDTFMYIYAIKGATEASFEELAGITKGSAEAKGGDLDLQRDLNVSSPVQKFAPGELLGVLKSIS